MSILKIKVENSKFVDATCENGSVEKCKPRRVLANGWDCRIFGNGKIYCEARENYDDGEHFMKFVVNSYNTYQLKLKKPNQPTEIVEKGYIPNNRIKSIKQICLTGGPIDARRGYFLF